MTNRFLMDKDKLVISKSGENVLDPNLTDEEKLFDSRWAFSKFLLAKGNVTTVLPYPQLNVVYFPKDFGSVPLIHRFTSVPIGGSSSTVAKALYGGPDINYIDYPIISTELDYHTRTRVWQTIGQFYVYSNRLEYVATDVFSTTQTNLPYKWFAYGLNLN